MTSGGALLIALLLQSPLDRGGAPADATPTKARLELRGAADCISRGDLAARVAARTQRVQFVDDAAIYAQVVLTSARPGNVVAELVLATPGAAQPPRRFAARTCAEAADAVALIIAVTLDPTLKRVGASDTGAASSTTEAGTVATAKPADQSTVTKPPEPPATVESAPLAAPLPTTSTPRHFGVYLAGQSIFGAAPAVMPGIALHGMAALDRDGLWAPALFIAATRVWRSDLSQTGGTASFTLDAATLDACPLRLSVQRLAARPCAFGLVGRLASSGAGTDEVFDAARPFAAGGIALAANAALGSAIELYARLGLGLTLLRDRYEFDATTFYRAGRFTTSASVGIGARWP